MPYPNYWAVRLREPEEFEQESFFTKEIGEGILAILGKIKDKDLVAMQSLRFSKEKYKTKEEVEAILKNMNLEYIKIESEEEGNKEGDKEEKEQEHCAECGDKCAECVVCESSEIEKKDMQVFKEINEAEIVLAEKNGVRGGYVKCAQVADKVNRNKRIYPKDVLAKAVAKAKEHIQKWGCMFMDTMHRTLNGSNYRDFREVVAVIKDIDFDGTNVSIRFELVDTSAGKDFGALVEAGAKFQVSQRGIGLSKKQKLENGEEVEVVTELIIEGFDFVAPDTASVEDAIAIFESKNDGGMNMEDKEVKELVENAIDETISIVKDGDAKMQEELEQIKKELEQIKMKEKLEQCNVRKRQLLDEMLKDNKVLTEKQKDIIAEKVKCDDCLDDEATLRARLQDEVNSVLSLLAETEKQSIKTSGERGRVVVLNEEKRWMELTEKLERAISDNIKKKTGYEVRKKNSDVERLIARMVEKYEMLHHERLLNEAYEVVQANIGVKVATIGRSIIPIAFRTITAFDVCDVGTMSQRIENILVATWNRAMAGDHTDMFIEVTEGSNIPNAGVQYVAVPILATRKALRTVISPEAIATAKGVTGLDPIEDSITALGIDIAQRIDQLLWHLMIAQAQLYSYGQVTTYEVLTKQSDNVTYKSANKGWIAYEYVKSVDANGNPTTTKLVPLFGTGSGNTIQRVVVAYGTSDTILDYATDYTVNWADGSIKLTATGAGKVGANAVKAKYSYTTNASFWSVIPDEGVSGYENLINLRQAVGRSKTLVASRNYNPTVLACSYSMEDLMTSSPMFSNSGATPADLLDKFNNIAVYAGMDTVKTPALPDHWLIVMEKGACVYRNFIPLSITGDLRDIDTGDQIWIAEEFSGQDVPVKGKLALVGICDLSATF